MEEALAQAKATGEEDTDATAAAAEQQVMKFQCPECESQYDNWLELVEHVGVHGMSRLDTDDGNEEEEADPATPPAAGAKRQHKCELCYKAFSTEDRLKVRIRKHLKYEHG